MTSPSEDRAFTLDDVIDVVCRIDQASPFDYQVACVHCRAAYLLAPGNDNDLGFECCCREAVAWCHGEGPD